MTCGECLQCLHLYDIRLQDDQNDNNNHIISTNSWKEWTAFAAKLGQQLVSLSIGGLTAVDQSAVDILLSHCVRLDELKIANEIDIISYLAIIRRTVKRIYINCEHGIGMECVSMLAFRNEAEKVLHLGRVDVPAEIIDSVISCIGSNFCNLKRLSLRLRQTDIDVRTPTDFLFEQLDELNLQFVSGSADLPFQKLIALGWTAIRCLTVQYASFTRHSAQAIQTHLQQLEKLVLHAVEFRCDHLSKRYGHRLCVECGRYCWTALSQLSRLRHLRLHRAIIDNEICGALSSMSALRSLDLHYCSNVDESVVDVVNGLCARCPGQQFRLFIVTRGFLKFDVCAAKNLLLEIRH